MRIKSFLGQHKGVTTIAILALLIGFLFALPALGLRIYYMHILIGVFIWIIVASSLRVLDLSGQGSIGHAAFMAIGAYTSGILSKYLGWNPWITMLIGILATMIIAFLVAIPFTRVRGIYFTMVSLFFGIGVLAVNQVFTKYTGGYSGIGTIPMLFGYNKIPYYYFNLALMLICLGLMYRLEHSRIGLTWKAVKQSHSVASSIGINEAWQRILCFGVACTFSGIAGVAYTHYYALLTQETFSFGTSINVFVYMTVGGAGLFAGPIVGTSALTYHSGDLPPPEGIRAVHLRWYPAAGVVPDAARTGRFAQPNQALARSSIRRKSRRLSLWTRWPSVLLEII